MLLRVLLPVCLLLAVDAPALNPRYFNGLLCLTHDSWLIAFYMNVFNFNQFAVAVLEMERG
uniref:G-protein coupled receptors family 1 profile domain-containing protein n=1 Tax=Anguilla anguilla TaxID=7936 RepID=A0A0E9SJ41_ANGAN